MKITCYDILSIKRVMGKHHDLIEIVEGELHLSWWSNKGNYKMIVLDFNGHSTYFTPFLNKVECRAEEFNNLYGE